MKLVDRDIQSLPLLPEGLLEKRIDHIYSEVMLLFCEKFNVPTLGQLLAKGIGHMFCSTETFRACPSIARKNRVQSLLQPPGKTDFSVVLEYGTEHLLSDTIRLELRTGGTLATIARFWKKEGNKLYFQPIVIGAPWLSHADDRINDWAMWEAHTHFQHYIEDFDEFAKVREVAAPIDISIMKNISEDAFKQCLVQLLGDRPSNDWGGEFSDHFTPHIHLNGRRVTAAFVLKGPASFRPMTLNHLGKNNDQIYRLSLEPADVLFVQHSHDIGQAVRETLRAFAVQPGRPRRYCFIDGRDSLRLLQAYDLVDEAVSISMQSRRVTKKQGIRK